jgi:Spermine/spermidine synthase domain
VTAGARGSFTETVASGRAYAELFLISFLILFLELACIRWFGSMVVFLTFFTNVVLLATFLGMSVGCMTARYPRDLVQSVIPMLLLAMVLAGAVLWGYQHFGKIMIDVGGQGSPQQVYFGTEYRARDLSRFVVPIEAVAAAFFALIALVFVGLGQVMGRAFTQVPHRVAAYTINIAGSLAGIGAFALGSWLRTPPLVWFTVALAICFVFIRRRTTLQAGASIAILVTVVLASLDAQGPVLWSPYYKIRYDPQARLISTNNINHQRMIDVRHGAIGYQLPYLMNRDAGHPPFQDVLIIGAGTGNDVQAALEHGARRVDAVEIDPTIYDIGRADHPARPYQDPRVRIHIDDGRSFVRKTQQQYDLVVYALVDSLILHSGYSSLRLESFLFTEQAFRDIKARLKRRGVFTMYNYYRQGWVVGRLVRMAEQAFGAPPVVITLPSAPKIGPHDPQTNRFTFLLVGDVAAIRHRFEAQRAFWVHDDPGVNESVNGFGPRPPAPAGAPEAGWHPAGVATVDTAGAGPTPVDDWPFLYLREAVIPTFNVRGIVMIALISLAILFAFAPRRRVRLNWQMFFLGAGFMLLETKSVVHMALLFGATWMVNSIVFFAILIMILGSNLFVLAARPRTPWPYYALLVASLVVNVLVPMSAFLALPGSQKVVASCAVVFVPIFFAGIIFGMTFRDSRHPDVDFGSNIAGAVLGGLSEHFSLMVGFNHLLVIAIVFYLLSAVLSRPLARSRLIAGAMVAPAGASPSRS